jgi:hypothetical protein
MFIRKTKPIRIIGDPDKWNSTVLATLYLSFISKVLRFKKILVL